MSNWRVQGMCAQLTLERKDEDKLCDHLIMAARRRDHVIAVKQRDRVLNIMTNRHGTWGTVAREYDDVLFYSDSILVCYLAAEIII